MGPAGAGKPAPVLIALFRHYGSHSPETQGLAVGQSLKRDTALTGLKGPYNCSSLVFLELLCEMWMYREDCGAWLLSFSRVDGY